jgi:endonuclease/exonuclease/phosphatase family metal-dependent hydrolase/glycosyltransferase involved in cell wall biosynthesis
MNILMLTNTFTPHLGGVARSVQAFAAEYRRCGHRVLVVAPQFPGTPAEEQGVVRIPAIQNFNGSDFSLRLPVPGLLTAALAEFAPEVVHSHHPFLLGDTALRIAAARHLPLVFTHHTMYERYTHYVPGDSPAMARFVMHLASGYANLCDRVFAPSESVAAVLRTRGVLSPIDVVPTGVDVAHFSQGSGARFRLQLGIPEKAFVVGHAGRLAPEKNLMFLAEAVAALLRKRPNMCFLVIGAGPSQNDIRRIFARRHILDRLFLAGPRSNQELVDSYHAMDVFSFASHSETQGMVLTEAMAAGVPVVAVDAPGAREVVNDGENGRLLANDHVQRFAAAIDWVATADPQRREAIRAAAGRTADAFSMSRQADKALAVYQQLLRTTARKKDTEHSPWESALRWVGAEWELLTNMARAAGGALPTRSLWRRMGLGGWMRSWRRLRRLLSRSEWSIRLLRLPVVAKAATERGLVLLQIDGLSQTQFERALARRRMPFLRRLLGREGYQVHTFYSGLPSSTPAVQGELFYGVKTAVPGFSFRDHHTGQLVRMYDAEAAAHVQSRLGRRHAALLEGGSAYCNIYSGGAAEAHFCSSAMGWGHLLRRVHLPAMLGFMACHSLRFLRMGLLSVLEFVLAVGDFFRGWLATREFYPELKFIATRVAIGVWLRELITMGAVLDVRRGLPIVHLNFIGYDEHAHRRGPGSAFAQRTLGAIDDCIRQIWKAARASRRRDYQIWIYADHGQETTTAYLHERGTWLPEALAVIFDAPIVEATPSRRVTRRGVQGQRSVWLGGRLIQKLLRNPPAESGTQEQGKLLVAAMGPVAHVYAPRAMDGQQRLAVARRIVAEAGVPIVVTRGDAEPVGIERGKEEPIWAVTGGGQFRLPDDATTIFGADHPFLDELRHDLADLCRHRDAGDFVLFGYRPEGPLSFPLERGAHAGPGSEETRAFALLPPGVALPESPRDYLRPADLRAAVLHLLHRGELETMRLAARPRSVPGALRVMTYNVHSCFGTDGRLSPDRIARLIAQYDPDVIALQELDVGRARSGGVDQAQVIAQELRMDFHFHPSLEIAGELYGNAILSRVPSRLVRSGPLPGLPKRPQRETRGALWVEISFDGRSLQIFNTHLGLSRRERWRQANELLGANWLGHAECRAPVIFCGDLNTMEGSRAYRRLTDRLHDVQLRLDNHRPQRTFFSHFPVSRIDHIFVSSQLQVVRIEVPSCDLARKASDHLPLVVDLLV